MYDPGRSGPLIWKESIAVIRLRLATGLATVSLALTAAAAAEAAPNTYCRPSTGTGSTTYVGSDGNWGDGDNWSAGLPSSTCDAVIPANATVTLTTTPGEGAEGT